MELNVSPVTIGLQIGKIENYEILEIQALVDIYIH
jgi:hypothetical protein